MKQTKKTPKISDFDTFSTTPYTIELTSKFIASSKDGETMTDAQGNLWNMKRASKGETVLTDPKTYTKLFSGNALLLSTLSDASASLFYYIAENLKPGRDEICVIQAEFLAFFNYKENNRFVYYKAVEGLLTANVISRRTGSTTCFFVNPDILFNGDRTKLKNVVIKSNRANNFNQDK